MNEDERLHRYLSQRADRIELPPLEFGTIVERSHRRHRRRRTTVGIATAALVLGVSVGVAANRGEKPDDVKVAAGAELVDSPLDWTVVDQAAGLGLGAASSLTATSGGATYSLSTAPGIGDPTACCEQDPASLYRSTDGATWEQVGLPADVWASGLAADGDRLYAVGTAPDGGGRKVVISASNDGGASWSTVDLPFDFATLEAKYPKQISPGRLSLATGPNGVIAALTVSSYPDVEALFVAKGIASTGNYSTTDTGVVMYATHECTGESPSVRADTDSNAAGKIVPPPLPADCVIERTESEQQSTTVGEYTWDELGVSAEQQSLIRGEVHVFASTDGETFTPVALPTGTTGASASIVADESGYHLIIASGGAPEHITALDSVDGVTWESSIIDSARWVSGAGLVDGRAAFSSTSENGRELLYVASGAGGWTSVDLTEATGIDMSQGLGMMAGAFGPLGFAALVGEYDDGDGRASHLYLVHTTDGVSVSVVDLEPLLDGDYSLWPASITITADAITVAFPKGSPEVPPTKTPDQILVVGTPR